MILAGFPSEELRDDALSRLRRDDVAGIEAYSPKPPENERSILPLVMLAGGVLGAGGGFWLQAWSTTIAYPIDIGGRPNLFWPSYIPFTFESGLMMAMIAGFLGYLVINRLPHLWAPIDESDRFRHAMVDQWFVAVSGAEGDARSRALTILRDAGATQVEDRVGDRAEAREAARMQARAV